MRSKRENNKFKSKMQGRLLVTLMNRCRWRESTFMQGGDLGISFLSFALLC